MTAPVETSWRVRGGTVSTVRTERFRALLLVVMEEQAAEFERQAEALATLTSNAATQDGPRSRDCCASHVQRREAIERIEDALVRIDDGSYAICQSCGRPIPFERLEAIPQANSCAVCGTDSAAARSPSLRPVDSRRGHGRQRPGKSSVTTMATSATEEL